MDENLKNKAKTNEQEGVSTGKTGSAVDNQKRLEMYRKLRKDMETENKEEKEAAYQKRSDEIDKKDKSNNNGDDFLKGVKTYDIDDQ